ncbi:hypothetical protein SPAN111604_02430 [Sphingomonas antarctica]|uniref:hypothetical protein n=1 Tax=Sphingomonas antarctica TaxID=2040274 RepID=UPI0039E86282
MPANLPRSERCSLLQDPDHPLPPNTYKGDCPKDATYIVAKHGGAWDVPNGTPYPVVVEGGAGNDVLTVTGHGGKGVYVDGGAGDDRLTVSTQSDSSFLGTVSDTLLYLRVTHGDGAALIAVGFVIMMCVLGVLCWRALANPRDRRPR